MKYEFLNIFSDSKELVYQSQDGINPFLFENNVSEIEQIYNFYKGDSSLLYVNGFMGTGKAEIIDYSLSFLSSDVIILKYNCFNSTVLDDVLLSFFIEFKNLTSRGIVSEPKVKTENFAQKINSYFVHVEKPFLIILDSFEAVLDENRSEILDFIFHLNSMNKSKVIIVGRTFESKFFNNINLERITTLALEKSIFEKILKTSKIKANQAIIDEFYLHTRGYYFFTMLSLQIMKVKQISLVDFLVGLKNSYLPFFDFLKKEALVLVPPIDRTLFSFLCLIRHPVSTELLKVLDFCSEDKINQLIDNLILFKDGSEVYVPDYLKEDADESISANISNKLRQYIVDLYTTQLPLKPLERNICISRQTMRKEIEFHTRFLPKKPKNITNPSLDINYLSYSQIFDINDKSKLAEPKAETSVSGTQKSTGIDYTQRKNVNINLENLQSIPEKQPISKMTLTENNIENPLSLQDILIKIKMFEKDYNYSKVIEFGQKALELKNEKEYDTYLPLLYTKIARAYKKNADYEHSLSYYLYAIDYYHSKNDVLKVNRIKFSVANIYYETFKLDKAKELFFELATSPTSPAILVVKSYIKLANIEEDALVPDGAFEYYQKALENVHELDNVETLSELYFKYALLLDDRNEVDKAIEYYNKCINLGDDESLNKFLSPTYSNIATLYYENGDIDNSIKNYLKAYDIDKRNKNLEGIYYSASKLASILHRKSSDKALGYYKEALDAASKINDTFYIITSTLEIGDYHYDKRQDEIALKYYLSALEMSQDKLSSDNIQKINIRINDLKFRMGNDKFETAYRIIKESGR